ncbi:50S ribosomal protein L17 [Patescibacteria group bacterium]|nr:50S ribosomal protein L17 [Patescibacteria group bacterium]MBU1705396.1 50S ribosomal protein L17 [Patescibacteria group bacterium]
MRHRKTQAILGREKAPREAMLRNLAASVVLYEKVQTTLAKAKAVQPLVEKAITIGKESNLTNRRKLLSFFYTDQPINKIFEVLGPRYQSRTGGYTRIIKTGPRKNDGAEMVQIELV